MRNHSFGSGESLPVRYFSEEQRLRLLDTLERTGIYVGDQARRKRDFSPTDTNTYAVNIKNGYFDYLGEPWLCAAMVSSGVRFYTVAEFCRMAEFGFSVFPRFPIFHVPHDGEGMPQELMASVCIPREQFLEYHEKMRDRTVSELIPRAFRMQRNVERFRISRLLCDVERFLGPEEIMEQYGMGFCYERAYDGTRIKNVTDELKALTLRYYQEHQQQMDWLCTNEKHNRVLLFDLHSYWDGIIPKELLKDSRSLPDVCIGTDPVFTPPKLVSIVQRRLEAAGLSTAVDYPYQGCFVPKVVAQGNGDCASIMLEFHRRAYLDSQDNIDENRAAVIRDAIEGVIVDCVTLDIDK